MESIIARYATEQEETWQIESDRRGHGRTGWQQLKHRTTQPAWPVMMAINVSTVQTNSFSLICMSTAARNLSLWTLWAKHICVRQIWPVLVSCSTSGAAAHSRPPGGSAGLGEYCDVYQWKPRRQSPESQQEGCVLPSLLCMRVSQEVVYITSVNIWMHSLCLAFQQLGEINIQNPHDLSPAKRWSNRHILLHKHTCKAFDAAQGPPTIF